MGHQDGLPPLPDGLPAGRVVCAGEGFAEAAEVGRGVLWVSDGVVADAGGLWERLYRERGRSGWYPLLLETLRGDGERPWRSGELGFVPVERVDALDGGAVLAGLWPNLSDDGDGDLRTGPWPGTAEAVEIQDDPDAVAAETALLLGDAQEWLLGLVPAARGADAPALCGWSGPVNYTETAELCAVLRDWEDRLGARVITVGFDTLGVSVAAPPADAERARAVAVEHYAFCADVIDQGMEPDAYVASLVGRPFWSFWWD